MRPTRRFTATLASLSALALLAVVGTATTVRAQTTLKAADVHPPGYSTVVAVENPTKTDNGWLMFVDKPSYRLGRKSRLVVDRQLRDQLRAAMLEKGVRPAADRMAQRLNAASSWGGYEAWHGRQSSMLIARGASRDSDRGRRMLTAASGAADSL